MWRCGPLIVASNSFFTGAQFAPSNAVRGPKISRLPPGKHELAPPVIAAADLSFGPQVCEKKVAARSDAGARHADVMPSAYWFGNVEHCVSVIPCVMLVDHAPSRRSDDVTSSAGNVRSALTNHLIEIGRLTVNRIPDIHADC